MDPNLTPLTATVTPASTSSATSNPHDIPTATVTLSTADLGSSNHFNNSDGQQQEDDPPERLFRLLEDAVPRPDEANGNSSNNNPANAIDAAELTWDRVRRWLWDHEDPEFRTAAVCTRGPSDVTPLHLMCRLNNPPLEIIADIINAAPEVVTWTDNHGWLPLHLAAANGVSTEVLDLLTSQYPDSKSAKDNQGRTPLHFYVTRNSENPVVMAMNTKLLSDTGAPELPDRSGMLPIHYACAYGTHPAVLKVLADYHPGMLLVKENKGRTPMHLAMANANRNADPGVIRFLLSGSGRQAVNMRDSEGKMPLHSLSTGMRGLAKEDSEKINEVSEWLKMYLAAEPHPSPDFLTTLQELPDDLQDVAVVCPHVRNILNKKIVQRFPTSILMLDGYWLIIIIICFEITTTNEVDSRIGGLETDDNFGALVVLFMGAFYFLARELIQILSLWSLGSLSSWFFDATNWLDMAVITMVSYYAILMAGAYEEWGADQFRSGVAFTKLVLWMAVISFLKSTLVDFAVFVGGVFYVVRRLVAFLLAVAVILLAFAQMFFIVYSEREVCRHNPADSSEFEAEFGFKPCDFPHCTFVDSLLKVYTMMMGEIGTESRYDDVLVAQILYFFYAFLVVILLSNVLIAIVTDSYEIIQNDRAAIVFWSNRLDFVAEMDAISSVIDRRFFFFSKKKRKEDSDDPAMQEGPHGSNGPAGAGASPVNYRGSQNSKDRFREFWKQITDLFEPNFYDDIDLRPSNIEFWCYLCYQGFAMLILIPGWLAVGLLTAGWLWPPQVREYLFVQKETVVSRGELQRQKLDQLRKIQTNITKLKADVRRELASDRDEMVRMKAEVEAVQSEVLSDLQQVKELMTTLLDLGAIAQNG